MRGGPGFTLIEAVVVVAIAAILLAVGVPSFSAFLDRSRVTAEVNQLLSDLALARSEAVTRRGRVVLCRSAQPAAADAICAGDGTDWGSGWIVFADHAVAGTAFQRDPAEAAEAVIRAHVPASSRITIQANPALAGFAVTADGTLWLLNGDPLTTLGGGEPIRFDVAAAASAHGRSLCVAASGRVRTSSRFGAC